MMEAPRRRRNQRQQHVAHAAGKTRPGKPRRLLERGVHLQKRAHDRLQADGEEGGEIGNENDPDRAVERDADDRQGCGEGEDEGDGEHDAGQRIGNLDQDSDEIGERTFAADQQIGGWHRNGEQPECRGGGEEQRILERRQRDRLAEEDFAIGTEGNRLEIERHAIGRHQRACDERQQGRDEHQRQQRPDQRLERNAPAPEREGGARAGMADKAIVAAGKGALLHEQPGGGDRRDQRRDQRDLAEGGGAETRQPAEDQGRQRLDTGGNAEDRGNAEIADAGDEGDRSAGDQPRSGQRQHDIAEDAERSGARKPRRLDAVAGACRKPGLERQEDERRMLHAQKKSDAGKRIERLRAAERRRQPQRLQKRARRPGHLHPGKRRHLRRDHHRQHEGEA
ncbi:hypothetical protein ABIE78_001200 [Sinorhizobium fredii]